MPGEIFRQRVKAYIGTVSYSWRRGRAFALHRDIIPGLQTAAAAALLSDDREAALRTLTAWLILPNQARGFQTLELGRKPCDVPPRVQIAPYRIFKRNT